jgi:hypothetical protein
MCGIYFAVVGKTWLKVGMSRNIEQRLVALRGSTKLSVRLVSVLEVQEGDLWAAEASALFSMRKHRCDKGIEWHWITEPSLADALRLGKPYMAPIRTRKPKPVSLKLRHAVMVRFCDAELATIKARASGPVAVYVRERALA